MISGMEYHWFWLVLAVVFGVIEIATYGIVTIWFTIGAIIAMILSLLGINFTVQIIVFIISSALMLYFTRPFIKNSLKLKTQKTNADRLIGEICEVEEEIDRLKGSGRVKIFGQSWKAYSDGSEIIEVGELAEIIEIKGVKLVVKKFKK